MKRATKKKSQKGRRQTNSRTAAKRSAARKTKSRASAKTSTRKKTARKQEMKEPVAKLNRRKHMPAAKKSSGAKSGSAQDRNKATPQDPKKEIEEIKKQLRRQITTGKDVTNLSDDQALEARSLQMRVAQLEAAVARAENADAKSTPGLELKVRARTEDLKTRLKDA